MNYYYIMLCLYIALPIIDQLSKKINENLKSALDLTTFLNNVSKNLKSNYYKY